MKKILIVDDSLAQVKLIQTVLNQAGYKSVALHDPRYLESTVEMERPNLILMDVVMPERNGFQACRELKSHAEFGSIPILMVSSKDSDSDRFWATQQGADGYVVKPFTPEQLLGAVQRFV